MKACMECGKNLGIIEGYRHPTMGQDHLLCGHCFDTVSESVERWSKVNLPYVEFFAKKSSTTDDLQKMGENITKAIKKMQLKVSNLRLHTTN